jgi:hypothetical protein
MSSLLRLAFHFGLPLVALLQLPACGGNEPEIPPELLACDGSGAGEVTGTEEGDVMADATFQGWLDPQAALATTPPEPTETIRFSDFGATADATGAELLLVNSAALWCSACREEHERLPELYAGWAPRGLVIFTLIFQDGAGNPATVGHLEAWGRAYGTNFPLAIDPELVTGLYSPPEAAPLNMLVDVRTRTILSKVVGNQEAALTALIERELGERGR